MDVFFLKHGVYRVSAAVVFLKTKLIITGYEKIPKTIQDTVFKYFRHNRTDRDFTEVVHCDKFTINTIVFFKIGTV